MASEKSLDAQVARNPLPPKIAALVRESWWLAFLAVALYLLLVLFTFHKGDPGWSHSIVPEHIENGLTRRGDLELPPAQLVRQVGQRLLDEPVRMLVLGTGPAHDALRVGCSHREPTRDSTNNPARVKVMHGPLGRLSG